MTDQTDQISFDEFCKTRMRVGKVVEAADHPNADKLLILQVAGLKGYYTPEQLVGRNIIVVTNLAPRMMRGQQSQGMLLAASTEDQSQVILLTTMGNIAPGSAIS